ncbi:hypothetical protein ACEWY4_022616 [Coilia grayii]|uniref:Uncharacterized protein n=1 Tax=Coilia grayii TaxID=363190 RepID=A0ABD1J6J6_9TELE
MALKLDTAELAANSDVVSNFEYRIKFKSRTIADYQLKKYNALLNNLLVGQNQIAENLKIDLIQELVSTFQSAVEGNAAVDGHSGEDVFSENVTMNDLLDDQIVDTTTKRRCYPTRIVPFVLRSLKAQRKLMGMYQHVIDMERIEPGTAQGGIMKNVLEEAPTRFKQKTVMMKSFQEVCVRAEGLHQMLSIQPSAKSLAIYRFGSC